MFRLQFHLALLLAVLLAACDNYVPAEQLLQNAYDECQAGLYAKARESSRLCLRQQPKKVEALLLNGYATYRDGKAKDAEEPFRQAASLDPDSFMTQYFMGWYYHEEGQYEKAFERFLKAYPKRREQTPEARMALLSRMVDCRLKIEGKGDGMEYLMELSTFDAYKNQPEVANAFGMFQFWNQNYQNAENFFKTALTRSHEENAAYLQNLAVLNDIYLRRPDKAREYYLRAEKASSGDLTRQPKLEGRRRQLESAGLPLPSPLPPRPATTAPRPTTAPRR